MFHNLGSTSYRLWTNNGYTVVQTPTNLACCGLYRIGLYSSTDLAAPEGALMLSALTTNAAPIAAAGRFNAGSAVPLAGIAPGTQILFQVRAWAINPLDGATGRSRLGLTTVGGGIFPPGELFGTRPGLLTEGFCIGGFGCVPEPSSGALAVLGLIAAALVSRSQESR